MIAGIGASDSDATGIEFAFMRFVGAKVKVMVRRNKTHRVFGINTQCLTTIIYGYTTITHLYSTFHITISTI